MIRTMIATVGIAALAAEAQSLYDFTEVRTIAQGAVLGQTTQQPVSGFELLIMKDGRVVFHEAFGAWAVGRIANADSATKTLSGALVMSMTDSSNVPFSLRTRVSELIPEFTGPKANITIAQCFSHTSGLRTNGAAVSSSTITIQQAAQDIADDPLQTLPGTAFYYGGTSMHAAGAAVEVAGGQPWDVLIRSRILNPLDMSQTNYVLSSTANPWIAGGAESNAAEFARFMEMLRRGGVYLNRRVLSERAVSEMFTRQTPVGIPILFSPMPDSADYGVGVWLDRRDAQGNLVGAQAAGARGFSAWVDFDDGVVGALSTDVTSAQNIQPALSMIRAAAERIVRSPGCLGDYDNDGAVDFNDYLAWLNDFNARVPAADLNADGGLDFNDYLEFLNRYYTPC